MLITERLFWKIVLHLNQFMRKLIQKGCTLVAMKVYAQPDKLILFDPRSITRTDIDLFAYPEKVTFENR